MSTTAVFTGAFDPITLGHLDVIERALPLFDRLIVGVGINPDKPGLWTPAERVALIRGCLRPEWAVEVEAFEGLTVQFVARRGARVILRGVRSMADMDYELTMAAANKSLDPTIETLFISASDQFAHISSSLIKHVARWGNRDDLVRFVPGAVIEPLVQKIGGPAGSRPSR